MSLYRSVTRKGAPTSSAAKKKTRDSAEQGLEELYPNDESSESAEIDIILVPGLGANPRESWIDQTTGFNWTTKDGLALDFPKSRILLYNYLSAWAGTFQVQQFMTNIAKCLLLSLRYCREKCPKRPLIFIGHSMGGLVIAKAVTLMAYSERRSFPGMFEATGACFFFGTPFHGTPAASTAALYAHVAEKFGKAQSSKLLEYMKVGSQDLADMRGEFVALTTLLRHKIRIICFYETMSTDLAEMGKIPKLFGLTDAVLSSARELVDKDSATLDGRQQYGLGRDHRNLVRFSGPKDLLWNQHVRGPMKEITRTVPLTVKNRFNDTNDVDNEVVKKVLSALDGDVRAKLKKIKHDFQPSSWIAQEVEFMQWLELGTCTNAQVPGATPSPSSCIWIRGPEGRGKTSAMIAAIEKVEEQRRLHGKHSDYLSNPVLFAYYFCAQEAESHSAEDIVKSLIWQLIDQNNSLVAYAKVFVTSTDQDDDRAKSRGREFKATLTIENLWQVLQDILSDEDVGKRVYLLVNNLHVLDSDAVSTIKLMGLLKTQLECYNNPEAAQKPSRWFITSRDAQHIRQSLTVQGTILVDLEDEKYVNQVQKELRTHAKNSVALLGKAKAYNKAIEYFATSVIGKRAQNTHWIDIIVAQLQQLSNDNLHVRVLLEETPQSLPELLTQLWLRIFRVNVQEATTLKEILRCLILTYEDPSEVELAALAGLSYNEEGLQRLRQYIKSCQPLLDIKPRANGEQKVQFIKPDVKLHLLENAQTLLGLSDDGIKWQHGVLAHRCFSHVRERFDFELTDADIVQRQQELQELAQQSPDLMLEEEEDHNSQQHNDSSVVASSDSGSLISYMYSESSWDSDNDDPEADLLVERALGYPVKYWLQHSSEATAEIAEDLSQEVDFWGPESIIRRRWLVEYHRLTDLFSGFYINKLTGLHVAAAAGFENLINALIRNGYKDEIDVHDTLANTPLHFAAFFGCLEHVEALLNHNAKIDDGKETGNQTPLCMAALEGRVEVMKRLLRYKADKNAMSDSVGPVICAAILSGNRAAVQLLLENDVSLTHDRVDMPSPLALAARMADMSMFEDLASKYKLPGEEYSKAMVSAAEADRMELFEHLLTLTHTLEYYQQALDVAAGEWHWEIVLKLLETDHALNCDEVVSEAAILPVSQEEIRERIFYTVAARPNAELSSESMADALYMSADKEKAKSVKLLLQLFNADPDATGEEYGNAVSASAYDGTQEILLMLLDAGATLNGPDDFSLQFAAAQGHFEVVRILLGHGAEVNRVTDREPGTALQAACNVGNLDMVKLLLENHADPNLGTGQMSPPLVAAACQGEESILQELVMAKADVNVFGGWDNSSVLIHAAMFLPMSSLELLLKHGADINLDDQVGNTPLIAAAIKGDVESVIFLLQYHADVTHCNHRNQNALQVALVKGHMDCVYALSEYVSNLLTAVKQSWRPGDRTIRNIMRSVTIDPDYKLKYETRSSNESRSASPTSELPLDAAETADAAPIQPIAHVASYLELSQTHTASDTAKSGQDTWNSLADAQQVYQQAGQVPSSSTNERFSQIQDTSEKHHQDNNIEPHGRYDNQSRMGFNSQGIDFDTVSSPSYYSPSNTQIGSEGPYDSVTTLGAAMPSSSQSLGEGVYPVAKIKDSHDPVVGVTLVDAGYSTAQQTIAQDIPATSPTQLIQGQYSREHGEYQPYGSPTLVRQLSFEVSAHSQSGTKRKPVPSTNQTVSDAPHASYQQFHAAIDNLTIQQQESVSTGQDQAYQAYQPYSPISDLSQTNTQASHQANEQQNQVPNSTKRGHTWDTSPPELNQKRSSFFNRTTFEKIIKR